MFLSQSNNTNNKEGRRKLLEVMDMLWHKLCLWFHRYTYLPTHQAGYKNIYSVLYVNHTLITGFKIKKVKEDEFSLIRPWCRISSENTSVDLSRYCSLADTVHLAAIPPFLSAECLYIFFIGAKLKLRR